MARAAEVRRDPAIRVNMQTKAGTLRALAPHLKCARVLPLAIVSLKSWRRSRGPEMLRLTTLPWIGGALAVRSSATGEDSETASQAGRYDSLLGVRGLASLEAAIEMVFASYPDANLRHEVLVQPMLADVASSGVAFSADPNSAAPYFVINYTDGTDTQAITSGQSDGHHTFFVSRAAKIVRHPLCARVCDLLHEIEMLTGQSRIDIEFAFDQSGELYLFQARPLVMSGGQALSLDDHARLLRAAETSIRTRMQPHPYLLGRRTVFGVMPDWNPAEIIGTRPRPLALSLYRELVTDAIWAYQRHNYGYRNLRSFPLLCDFHGVPFIDVRVSFNSFLPGDLPEELAGRLCDHYIDELCRRPFLHDKVEFEIIYSCYTLDLPDRLRGLAGCGFGSDDIAHLEGSLRTLTNHIINAQNGLWKKDLDKLDVLERRYATIVERSDDPVAKIYWLIEDCKRYGTLPFAGLARAGFIAVQLLRSLVAVGVLSEADYQQFLASLNTVSSEMGHDFRQMDRSNFLARYGHLRPGTYDIRSPRYDVAPDHYFNWTKSTNSSSVHARQKFSLTLEQMNAISVLLVQHRLDHDVVGLFNFLKAGIEGREKAKFVFSRSLSQALECLAQLGEQYGFNRDDMSYMNIATIHALHSTCNDPGSVIARSISEGRERHAHTLSVNLPSLITSPDDVWFVETAACEPNFITQLSVEARVAGVDEVAALRGSIVVIPSADPGYDWLFSHGIAGLITAYGGINSHMAIRAGELQIPAVIGAGEALYGKWAAARMLHIDCANRCVQALA